nr:hypothetical protein [Cressdnaviricota sp.]
MLGNLIIKLVLDFMMFKNKDVSSLHTVFNRPTPWGRDGRGYRVVARLRGLLKRPTPWGRDARGLRVKVKVFSLSHFSKNVFFRE